MTSNGKREQNILKSWHIYCILIFLDYCIMFFYTIISLHMRTSCNAVDRAVQWHHGLHKTEYFDSFYENNDKKQNILFFLGFTLGNMYMYLSYVGYIPFLLILIFLFRFLNITYSVVYEIRSSCDQRAMFILQVTALRIAS